MNAQVSFFGTVSALWDPSGHLVSLNYRPFGTPPVYFLFKMKRKASTGHIGLAYFLV